MTRIKSVKKINEEICLILSVIPEQIVQKDKKRAACSKVNETCDRYVIIFITNCKRIRKINQYVLAVDSCSIPFTHLYRAICSRNGRREKKE